MRSVPFLAYVVCGLALGVVLYLCWRANAHKDVDSEQEEGFTLAQLDPPTAPCNVDFGSLVQDQFLAENANHGSNKCSHQYPDPTVFGGEIRMQQSPKTFVFCTSKDASHLDKCPAECEAGGCVSLQSEADNITRATRNKTKQFIKSLNQFEHRQFGPMRNLFDGVIPQASEYAEAEAEAEDEGPPPMLIQGVHPTLKAELARRRALIHEMNSLQTDIQTASDALEKVTPHAKAQHTCEVKHSPVSPTIRGMQFSTIGGIQPPYYKDSGVASQSPPTDYDLKYATTDDGYSCFTQTPDSKKYAKWLDMNDIDGKVCKKIVRNASTLGKLLVDDIRTKCEANQKCREQIKLIHPPSTEINQHWRNVIANDTPPNMHKKFPKIPAFDIRDKSDHKCWTLGPTNKLKIKEKREYISNNRPVRSWNAAYKFLHKSLQKYNQKKQCDRLSKYPSHPAYNYIQKQCLQNTPNTPASAARTES